MTPQTTPTFFVSRTGQQREVEVLEEMKDLGGVTITVCNKANENIRKASGLVLELNLPGGELALVAPHIVPSQLMGFLQVWAKGSTRISPKSHPRGRTGFSIRGDDLLAPFDVIDHDGEDGRSRARQIGGAGQFVIAGITE